MPYFVRAINRENWPEPEENATVHDLDADALNDIKTGENTLSVWYAESEEDIKDAAVAYLGSMDKWIKSDEVEFIAIDTKYIAEATIEIFETPNPTYVSSYETKHRDLCGLKYDDIEAVAGIVIMSINNGKDFMLTAQEIRDLFKEVIAKGLLTSDRVDRDRHSHFRKYVQQLEKELIALTQ